MSSGRRSTDLGPLERLVLDALWECGESDVALVHARIAPQRRLARNTVQTTLERLVRKRIATRDRRGRCYVYTAALTRSEWVDRALDELVASLPDVESHLLAASFVDLAQRTSEEMLVALERQIDEHRSRSSPRSDADERGARARDRREDR